MSDQDQWRKDLPEGWQGKQADRWDGEVPLKPIYWSAAAVAISVLVAFVFNAWLMHTWDGYRKEGVRQSPLAEARERALPVSPKLQPSPEAELIQMKAAQRQQLASYGWVDAMDQRVHIPVQRAMELVLEQKVTPGSIEPEPGMTTEPGDAAEASSPEPPAHEPSAEDTAAHDPATGEH